ncbi:MAG: serine/threonine-protein kinase, partial [Pirellulales bacterium]
MFDESRVQQLLEEVLDTQRTPEDVCAQCPELAWEVRERWRRCQRVESQIEALFPSTGAAENIGRPPLVGPDSPLPQISGYDVTAVLGHGGMGVVYRARHVRLNRTVALKMLLSGAYASAQELARFKGEAEAVASLRHANIVQVYDVGDFDGRPYFTMEFIEGGSLAQKLAGTPQPASHAAAMLAKLAGAVQAAHEGCVVHRDLKPANVLLDSDGTPKISDFGLARRCDDEAGLTVSGTRLGTPSYMAPEQAMGKADAVGPSVDIYALGAMLYEMLTGRPPFRAEAVAETQRQLISDEPVPPSRLNAKVPRDLETICLKCLQKDPQRRYHTPAELSADLERFLRHEPIHARRAGRLERGARWIRRNPTETALIVTALALIALVIGEGIREWALATGRRAEKARLTARFESGVDLVRQGRFAEARAILGRLGDGDFEDLRGRIDQATSELDLVERLDSIRLNRAATIQRDFNRPKADRDYEEAFASAG